MDKQFTVDDLLVYSKSYFREDKIDKDSNIIDIGYDGDDTYDYILSLRDKFNIDLSHFDYLKYFHTEAECSTFLTFSYRNKDRILEPLTFEELYLYMINHPSNYTKHLTLENLIIYLRRNDLPSILDKCSNLKEWSGNGSEAYSFFKELETEFNVSFKDFDFKRYFYSDFELQNAGCLFFWLRKKKREVEELTVKDLYEYMIKHQK